MEELDAYVDDMVAARRDDLTDDLLSELIRAESDGDRLNLDELRMLVAGFLMAGTDTTRNQLAASVQVLCEHPDQWAKLRDHPELAMQAVESMRHSPAAAIVPRAAIEDVEFGGYLFPAGTFVFANTFAANRDPAIYADADRFDIARNDAPAILTFGGGALLPWRQSRATRIGRSARSPHPSSSCRPSRRSGPMEISAGDDRSDNSSDRIHQRAALCPRMRSRGWRASHPRRTRKQFRGF